MPTKKEMVAVAEQEAKHGEKMIELKVRFWTNDLAKSSEKVVPKNAWSSGIVRMERNETHGIIPGVPIPFNSLLDLPGIMEEVLLNHGITLHLSARAKRYMK